MSDLIRREDAIKVLKHHLDEDYLDGYVYLNELEALPSAELERKTGEWIIHENYDECSKCHCFTTVGFNFCPHCGADMRDGE